MKKIVLIILVALLAWGGYLWRDSAKWDRRVEQHDELLEQGRRSETDAVRKSLREERPDDPSVLRLEARMATAENPRKALELLHRLRTRGEATWQDLALLVEITQDYPEVLPVPSILAELEKAHGEKPEVIALVARQNALEGRIDLALNRLSEVLTKFPDNGQARLQRARIMLLSPDLATRTGAKLALFELGKNNDRVGHTALRILVNREVGSTFFPEDALEASLALQRHPFSGDATYLRATSLRLRLEPVRRGAILAAAVERIEASDKVLLAVWLNTELAPALVLKTISVKDALAKEEQFFPRFQAFLLLRRTVEAHRLLSEADSVLGEAMKTRANAYLELAEGRRDGAIERFVQQAASSGDQQSLVDAGRLALLNGRVDATWTAYLQALRSRGDSIGQSVGLQLLQLALHRRETEVAWRTAKLLAERFSRRAGNRNNYAYLSLLLNREVQTATLAAEEAIKIGPRNTAFLSTLALARLRAGRWAEARELMERRGEVGLTPGERATNAAIFLALGREADAVLASKGLRPEMMLPEEWNLLGSLAVEASPKP